MSVRILFAEDDPLITRMVEDNLTDEGFEVLCVASGELVLSQVRSFAPDLILLDLMLPKLHGFEICSAISESPRRIPIVILSARSQVTDKLRAFELGADDYVTKPFTFEELLARVRALLRRTSSAPDTLELGDVRIDFSALRATKNNRALALTQQEFEVLRLLWVHRDKIVTREQLLRSVWGYSEIPLTRTVDYFIARLRSRLEPDPHHPRYLRTVYGEGYRLTPKG